jgi:hypothetical protein
MTVVQIWAWISGRDQYSNPIIEKIPLCESETPPAEGAWQAEQLAEAWWDEINQTGKGRKYLKYLAEVINDGRVPSWTVSPRQIRLALNRLGLRTLIENTIANSNNQDLKDYWEYSVYIDRYHPLVDQIAAQLGLTSKQIDDLFELAEKL